MQLMIADINLESDGNGRSCDWYEWHGPWVSTVSEPQLLAAEERRHQSICHPAISTGGCVGNKNFIQHCCFLSSKRGRGRLNSILLPLQINGYYTSVKSICYNVKLVSFGIVVALLLVFTFSMLDSKNKYSYYSFLLHLMHEQDQQNTCKKQVTRQQTWNLTRYLNLKHCSKNVNIGFYS